MSKGSAPRPFSVTDIEYKRRWDEILWKKPLGYKETKDCNYPHCSCATKCEAPNESTDNKTDS